MAVKVTVYQDSDGCIQFASVTLGEITLCPNVSMTIRELLALSAMEGVEVDSRGISRRQTR